MSKKIVLHLAAGGFSVGEQKANDTIEAAVKLARATVGLEEKEEGNRQRKVLLKNWKRESNDE